MRVDKFLWCTRYCKSRSIASEACRKGHVRVNGQVVKSSREVYPGDAVIYRKDQVNYTIEILDIPPSRVAARIVDLYRKDLTPPEEFATGQLAALAQSVYREKGTGRPTKKDRRELEDYFLSDSGSQQKSDSAANLQERPLPPEESETYE